MPGNLYEDGAAAYIFKHVRHLPIGILDFFVLSHHLAKLSADQDDRIQRGEPVAAVPILWIALAQTAGLQVDLQGCITGGPVIPEG